MRIRRHTTIRDWQQIKRQSMQPNCKPRIMFFCVMTKMQCVDLSCTSVRANDSFFLSTRQDGYKNMASSSYEWTPLLLKEEWKSNNATETKGEDVSSSSLSSTSLFLSDYTIVWKECGKRGHCGPYCIAAALKSVGMVPQPRTLTLEQSRHYLEKRPEYLIRLLLIDVLDSESRIQQFRRFYQDDNDKSSQSTFHHLNPKVYTLSQQHDYLLSGDYQLDSTSIRTLLSHPWFVIHHISIGVLLPHATTTTTTTTTTKQSSSVSSIYDSSHIEYYHTAASSSATTTTVAAPHRMIFLYLYAGHYQLLGQLSRLETGHVHVHILFDMASLPRPFQPRASKPCLLHTLPTAVRSEFREFPESWKTALRQARGLFHHHSSWMMDEIITCFVVPIAFLRPSNSATLPYPILETIASCKSDYIPSSSSTTTTAVAETKSSTIPKWGTNLALSDLLHWSGLRRYNPYTRSFSYPDNVPNAQVLQCLFDSVEFQKYHIGFICLELQNAMLTVQILKRPSTKYMMTVLIFSPQWCIPLGLVGTSCVRTIVHTVSLPHSLQQWIASSAS